MLEGWIPWAQLRCDELLRTIMAGVIGISILASAGCRTEKGSIADPEMRLPPGRWYFAPRNCPFSTSEAKPVRHGPWRRRGAALACSITTATAGSISSSRKADLYCRASDKTHRGPTRCACSGTWAAAGLKTSRRRSAWSRRDTARAWPWRTMTATAIPMSTSRGTAATRCGATIAEASFTDVTAEAGVGCGIWSLGAAFADYDGDGDLDLFVANYFTFDPAKAPFHRDPRTGAADYGMPARFRRPARRALSQRGRRPLPRRDHRGGRGGHGAGHGRAGFRLRWRRPDRLARRQRRAEQRRSGITGATARSRMSPSCSAWRSTARGRPRPTWASPSATPTATRWPDIMITHFFGEHETLWRLRGIPNGGTFLPGPDQRGGPGGRQPHLTGWGTVLADLRPRRPSRPGRDQRPHPPRARPGLSLREPADPLANRGNGRFTNVTSGAGEYFQALHMGRGLACGDLDGDGDLDLVIVHHHAASVVLWNESPRKGSYLIVKLRRAWCQWRRHWHAG